MRIARFTFRSLLVAVTMMAAQALAQTQYTVRDLGVLRGGSARVHGINSKGEIVGGSGFVYGTDRHAFLWSNGRLRDIQKLPGGDISEAFAINDTGKVVGTSNTAISMSAFAWTSTTGFQELATQPGINASQALGVNLRGDVVGISGTHAALWSAGSVIDLGVLAGGGWSEAHAINDAGQIVGYSSSSAGSRAVLWNQGHIQDLGILPGDDSSRANAINNLGTVIGASEGSRGVHAFTWDASHGLQPLEALSEGAYTEAFGINNSSQVVGVSGNSLGTHAVIWLPSKVVADLNTLVQDAPPTLVLTAAFAINDAGQIVAFGINEQQIGNTHLMQADREMHHAGTHVFLLTPR